MDAAPDARQAALIGSVPIGGPLQRHVHGRTALEHQEFVRPNRKAALAAREKRIASELREHFRGGAGVGRVAGDIAGERRRHETGALIGPPVLGQNPIDAGRRPVFPHMIRSAPREHLDLAFVFAIRANKRVVRAHQLNAAIAQGNAIHMVGRLLRVAALSPLRHCAQRRNRTYVVIPALQAPCGNGGVVHRAAESEIALHIPLQLAEFAADTAHPPFQQLVLIHLVEDDEPVARRRFGLRAVRPELGQHAAVVTARHPLRRVRLASGRVHLITIAGVPAAQGKEIRIVGEMIGVPGHVADAGRRDVHRHAVAGVQMRRPLRHQCEAPLVLIRQGAVHGRRRAGIRPHLIVRSVAESNRHAALVQCERHHRAPLRAQKLRLAVHRVAGLVHEGQQTQRLPAVQVHDGGIARLVRLERRIHRLIGAIGVVARLVAAVVQAESKIATRDVVAERRRAVGVVVVLLGGVVTERRHQGVRVFADAASARRGAKAGADDAVGGEAECFPSRPQDVRRRRRAIERAARSGAASAEQPGRRGVVMGRPSVPHGGRDMEQVAGMHHRARVVLADGLQQHLAPAPGHAHVRGPSDARNVVGAHRGTAARHREGRARGVRIRQSAARGGPVGEVVVADLRLGADGHFRSHLVGPAAAAAFHHQAGAERGLLQRDHLVRGYSRVCCDGSVGPAHLQIGYGGSRQAEMHFGGILRGEIVAGAHFAHLCAACRAQGDPRPHRARVAGGAHQFDAQVVVGAAQVVAVETQRVFAVVGERDVEVAISVRVVTGHAASEIRLGQAHLRRLLREGAVAVRVVEQHGVGLEPRQVPAVRVEDVQMAVVVEIRKAASPTPIPFHHAGFVGAVFKHAVASVAVQSVAGADEAAVQGLAVDRGDEPVHVAVVVVVANGGAHAVFVRYDVSVRYPRERAVAIVLVHLAGAEIPRHQQIQVAVVVDVAQVRRQGEVRGERGERIVGGLE